MISELIESATSDDWSRACALRAAESGGWPVLLEGTWDPDEATDPGSTERTAEYDAGELLAKWWREHALPEPVAEGEEDAGEEDEESRLERLGVIAPFGDEWPGLAPGIEPAQDPDEAANELGEVLLSVKEDLHLGLVDARSGAEALVVLRWGGPANYCSTPEIAAVVASWERRFGARVVHLEFDVLQLSVAAPPTTLDEALLIAAEHFAFCPDNIWQGYEDARSIQEYAEKLVGQESWIFWWD
jgi:hypothetical protein